MTPIARVRQKNSYKSEEYKHFSEEAKREESKLDFLYFLE